MKGSDLGSKAVNLRYRREALTTQVETKDTDFVSLPL